MFFGTVAVVINSGGADFPANFTLVQVTIFGAMYKDHVLSILQPRRHLFSTLLAVEHVLMHQHVLRHEDHERATNFASRLRPPLRRVQSQQL